MERFYYSSSIQDFFRSDVDSIVGELALRNEFSLEHTQRYAWVEQINILKESLSGLNGSIFFEYSIPRMGRRIDTVCLINGVIFVMEFKIGMSEFLTASIDQVMDYALDLKNFHETSHDRIIAPILIASKAKQCSTTIEFTPHQDEVLQPILCNRALLGMVINKIVETTNEEPIEPTKWISGRYSPTPNIIEAATALYRGHSVKDISRSDASGENLSATTHIISQVIQESKEKQQKSICFVTGVPGSGKTLIGLRIATEFMDNAQDLYSVFLSGNGPLVSILREALTRDKVAAEKEKGVVIRKGIAMSEVKSFIQNVHHFRDECLLDLNSPPIEHVVLFDEAQRAWNLEKTSDFMRRKKNQPNFSQSESEYLISCMDRHNDWATIVCLVGGGQEINTGEAGISEWIKSLYRKFPHWHVYISPNLYESEYTAAEELKKFPNRSMLHFEDKLHLAVSMRSFRAENVSLLVRKILEIEVGEARQIYQELSENYPIIITRSLPSAKKWLKEQARGSERYGIIVSSQAERLKPHAIDVKSPMDPIHWFLDGKEDVRSSFYLEDVATEFDIQGLELDWACVTWDADFRYSNKGWLYKSFSGDSWKNIKKEERHLYLRNAYRVLLTRARLGMVIVVPPGDPEDPTRLPIFYDPIYDYLKSIGFPEI